MIQASLTSHLDEEPYAIWLMMDVFDYSIGNSPWLWAELNLDKIQEKVDRAGKYIKLYLDDEGDILQILEVFKIEENG